MERFQCKLPGGFVDESGELHQQVALSPLSGTQEKLIAQRGRTTQSTLVTSLLSQCIRSIGKIDAVTEDTVRKLLVGDRQFLLLKLREITFGQQIRAVVSCSWPDCGERLDIDFLTDNIPITGSRLEQRFFTIILSEQAEAEKVIFRLPNGADQERTAHLVDENEALAETLLLSRCIQSIGSSSQIGEKDIADLSPLARREIEEEMDRLSPKVALTMEAFCPECQRHFSASFNLEDFVLRELHTHLDLLFKEVHYLAYHYHWSEKEILGMTRENRRRYIEILSDEMERLNHAS